MSDPARPGKFSGLSKLKAQAQATDWDRVRNTTDDEIREQIKQNPDVAPELTPETPTRVVRRKRQPATVEVQQVRKRGKRSDPDYMQITAFVKRETYKAAQKRILDESDSGQDFSDVVDALLAGWIGGRLKV